MSNPSTIAELFDNWQEGRTVGGREIHIMTRTPTGAYYVKFADDSTFNIIPSRVLLDLIPPLPSEWHNLLRAARALVDSLPASRVWTQEEIALVHAVAALTDPEPMPLIEQLTKDRALALGFRVKPFTVEDSVTGESDQRWYLERDNEFYLYGIKIDTCTVDVLHYHDDQFDTTAESAWQHLPMIDNRTGVIINKPYYSTKQQPTK